MLSAIFRFVWRLAIFVLGLYSLYLIVFQLLPYFDARLPLFIALLLVYCLLAYGLIPALMRLWRIVFKPNHIPLYVTTPDGWPADPVNLAIIANSRKHLVDAMARAGWYTADKTTLRTALREGWAILFDKAYPTAPFSNLYLFGRPFDVGFQLPRTKSLSPRARHHVRFWRLTPPDDARHEAHYRFWHDQVKHLLGTEKEVWIGAALDDTGPIGIRWRNGQLTHKNDSNDDAERDFIVDTLGRARQIRYSEMIRAGEPFRFRGQTIGNTFICDGTLKLVSLRGPISASLTAGAATRPSAPAGRRRRTADARSRASTPKPPQR